MKAQVVVLGRNYSSILGMIRAAGEAGHDVTVIRTVKKIPKTTGIKSWLRGAPIESKSKYVKKYLYGIEPNGREIIKMIVKEFSACREKVILIPTDDFTASAIDLNQDLLEDYFLYPNIQRKSGAIVAVMDKHVQKKAAINAGLNVAKGWLAEQSADGSYLIPEGISYPCFTKPQISFLGSKQYMKRCDTEGELKQLLKEIECKSGAKGCPILIEQFIEINQEFGVLGCSCDGRVVIPGIVEKLQSGHGAHKGVTLLGKVNSFATLEDLEGKLQKFVERLEFDGLFDIDLYKNGDTFYFNELNLRFGAFGYAITKSGVNLPKMFINYLLGTETDIKEEHLIEQTLVNDKVNLEDYYSGYVSWKEYQRVYKLADTRFIKNNEDQGPYREFMKIENRSRFKRTMKKIMGRK